MSARGFHTITLGCKLNQFDTAAVEGELSLRGFNPEADLSRAAVVVVNTCTVTGKADAEARKRIRHVRRVNPECKLLVTGCYAELDAESIRSIDEVDVVFGNRDKTRLPAILNELGLGTRPAADRGCDAALDVPRALHFGERSRAFLRIQEGCRLVCSYCVIPQVRGPSRSVPPEQVEEAARRLFDGGYREVVLTGVNTGDYGRDLAPRTDLAALLGRLLDAAGPNRIRLNSLEPLTVTDPVIDLMAADPRLCPHLQIPLQSGSESVLRRMRRNYTLAAYRSRLDLLRRAVPHVGLGADVIVGFPGESDGQFEETYDFIADSPLNYLHVFSWSPRPGTPAADYADRVHGGRVRERSARLRELADRLSLRFRKGFVGETLDAVALGSRSTDGKLRALTGNFIEVVLDEGTAEAGSPVAVRITDASPTETTADTCGLPKWAVEAGREVRGHSTERPLGSIRW